ncbi:MAG: ATP-binding protein [Nannocystaceae bacterium]
MAAPPILGREEPLQQLQDAFAAARGGRGNLVAIEGEAGIGKSALVTALLEHARSAGATVAQGRAWEQGAPPYFAVAPCVRSLGLELQADGGDAHASADYRGWERAARRARPRHHAWRRWCGRSKTSTPPTRTRSSCCRFWPSRCARCRRWSW